MKKFTTKDLFGNVSKVGEVSKVSKVSEIKKDIIKKDTKDIK